MVSATHQFTVQKFNTCIETKISGEKLKPVKIVLFSFL